MKKLTKKWQILLYATSGLGINMLNLMMNSYLCSALLVGGFGEAAVPFQTFAQRDLVLNDPLLHLRSLTLWGLFVLIAKIVDGVIDVPMAAFTDALRSRWGRRRPSLLIGLVPLLLSYLLFLVIPQPGATLLNTLYYGVVLCVFYTSYTLTMVTYYATYTEIVDSTDARNLMSNAKSVFDIFYFILGYVGVRALLNGINIRPVALMVLPLSMTMLIPLFMIKEPSSLDGRAGGEEGLRTVDLISSLRYTFRNRPFIIWMLVYSFMTFGVQLFLGGINEYFSYVGMSMILVMIAAFAPVPFTLILYNRILTRRGFGYAFRYALLTFSLGMICMFAVSRLGQGTVKTVLSIVTGLMSSLAIGALFAVAYSVPSQLAAEEEGKTGVSNSAMYFAVQGLFAGVASGIGTGLVLNALKGTESAASGAIRFMTLIAAAGTLLSFVLTYTLPRSMAELGKEEKESRS